MRLTRWRGDVLAVIVLLALTIIYYRSTLLTNSIHFGFDIFTYFYPNEQFAVDSIRNGALPLWNPYLFSGVPFLANMQTAVFYPPNLLFLLSSIPRAYAHSVALHVFLAGLFTYIFLRASLRLGPVAALAGAATFAFGGFSGSLVGHLNQLQATAWLPLLLLLVHQAWTRASIGFGILGGIAVAVQLLAGHAQESYMTAVAVLLFVAYLFWQRISQPFALPARPEGPPLNLPLSLWARVGVRATLPPLIAMGIVGLGLAAVQIFPSVELSALSIRSGGMSYQEATTFSFPPWMTLKGLLPVYADPQPFSEYMAYVGVFGLVIAFAAMATRLRRPFVAFFVVAAAIALFLALGQFNPLYPAAHKLVPGLNLFRVPARWLLLYSFSISVLVGVGVAAMGAGVDRRAARRAAWRSGAIVAVFLAILATVYLTARSTFPQDMPGEQTVAVWAISLAVAAALLFAGTRVASRFARAFALALILVELFAAGAFLPLNQANIPEAYTSMRPAVAFFLTDPTVYRALPLSENTFDPGDIHEIKAMLSKSLSPAQVYDYLVATKLKETLMPNLPLRYSIATFDGYDGGLLPLKSYANFKQLLIGKSAPDARLREEIKELPESKTLAWLNIKYVLMDRIRDAWVDGVYYDLAIRREVSRSSEPVMLTALPPFETTTIGIVSHLLDSIDLPNGTAVATLGIIDVRGKTYEVPLRAGVETAEGAWEMANERGGARHQQARKAKAWKGDPRAWDYLGVVSLPEPIIPREIAVRYAQQDGQVVIKGISQIDDRTGTSRPIPLSGSFKLVHIGDVKIYENLDVLPRAFVAREPVIAPDEAGVIQALRDPRFRPDRQVVLLEKEVGLAVASGLQARSVGSEDPTPRPEIRPGATNEDRVRIDLYQPTRVVARAVLDSPGFLVLTDSHYPGWRAFVDGKESPILQADYLFRGIQLDAGEHVVEFRYEPGSLAIGGIITGLTLSALALYLLSRYLLIKSARGTMAGRSNPSKS